MLSCSHVFGCPVYILDPALQDGKKILKWDSRAHQGIFVGFSHEHSSLVPLIFNPHTQRCLHNIMSLSMMPSSLSLPFTPLRSRTDILKSCFTPLGSAFLTRLMRILFGLPLMMNGCPRMNSLSVIMRPTFHGSLGVQPTVFGSYTASCSSTSCSRGSGPS